MKKQLSVAVTAALASGLFFGTAQAAIITVAGNTVEYTFDDALFGLFGNFALNGDKLTFDPTVFKATIGTPGTVTTSQTTPIIGVKAKSGFTLNGARVAETGDYFRIGDNTGVAAFGQFIVNGSPIQFSAGNLTDVTTFASPNSSPWTVDVSGALTGDAGTLKLQNILVAGVGGLPGLTSAFIEKKFVDIWVTTSAVPIPPAAWMLGSAMIGLVTVTRRKFGS